jgi:hypothetical protein
LVGINQLFDVKTQAARVWYDHFGWPSWFYFWGSNIWQRQTIIHRLFGNFKALWAWLTVIWFYCTLFEEMSLVGIFNPETIVQNPSQRGLGPASGIQTWSSCQLIGLEKGWESSIVEPVPSFPRFTKLFFTTHLGGTVHDSSSQRCHEIRRPCKITRLCQVMLLDVPTTERFINDCVSFHFDIVQWPAAKGAAQRFQGTKRDRIFLSHAQIGYFPL